MNPPPPPPAPVALRRVDPARNMARFYLAAVQPTLFGGVDLVRNFGRIGGRGRLKIDAHLDEAAALAALARILAAKRRRGYR